MAKLFSIGGSGEDSAAGKDERQLQKKKKPRGKVKESTSEPSGIRPGLLEMEEISSERRGGSTGRRERGTLGRLCYTQDIKAAVPST